jgi:hypothetical protein
MEEACFNVMRKEISETTYLKVTDIILKFKHQKAQELIKLLLQKVGPAL